MRRNIIFLIAVAMVSLPLAASAAVSRSGFGKGVLNNSVYTYNGTPLLSDFYFRFTRSDHHVTNIGVLPEPASPRIDIMYTDKNHDDEYFYRVGHEERSSTAPSIFRNRRVFFCKGSCVNHPIPHPTSGNYTFVLVGFRFSYRVDDHHIDEVGIREHNGLIDVFFNDKNDDDPFIAWVDYAYVPSTEIASQGVVSGADDRGGASRTIPQGTPVIRGFHFNFRSGDHHIKDIGVMTYSNRIDVFYGDRNQDDRFSWNVRYATLRNPVVCCIDAIK